MTRNLAYVIRHTNDNKILYAIIGFVHVITNPTQYNMGYISFNLFISTTHAMLSCFPAYPHIVTDRSLHFVMQTVQLVFVYESYCDL